LVHGTERDCDGFHHDKFIDERRTFVMGRYLLLWLLGVPIPILLLIWAFGGLN
jgi:hypothetical protein